MLLAKLRLWLALALRAGLYAGIALALVAMLTADFARSNPYLDMLSSFQRQYAVGTVVLLGAAVALRRWRAAGFTALLLGLYVVRLATALPASPKASGRPPDLKALSANLLYTNRDAARILAWADEKDPDILAFQEYGTTLHPQIATALRTRYPYAETAPANNPRGIAFYSRFPFRRVALPPAGQLILGLNGRRKDQLAVFEILAGGTTITVIHVHPPPPIGATNPSQRNVELEILGRLAAGCKTPLVILGDFNATPWSPYFQDLLKAGELHSPDGGLGMTPTWPVHGIRELRPVVPTRALDLARIPIDFFLGGPGIAFQNFARGPDVGSDHFPLYAEMLLPSP